MPSSTTTYGFNLPLVNDPTDADLWGGQLNSNWTNLDSLLTAAGITPSTGALSVPDNTFRIVGSGDATKKAAFEVDGLTTATTRTYTLQNADGTLYQTGGTDIAIADGGTGASTALAGFDALKQQATTIYAGVNQLRAGQVIQSTYDVTTAATTVTSIVPFDNTPPTTGETQLILTSSSLTPTSASSKLRVTIQIQGTSGAAGSQLVGCLYRDAGTNAVATAFTGGPAINVSWSGGLVYEVVAGSTTATTFSLRAGVNAGTNYVNSGNATALFNGTLVTSITVQEIQV